MIYPGFVLHSIVMSQSERVDYRNQKGALAGDCESGVRGKLEEWADRQIVAGHTHTVNDTEASGEQRQHRRHFVSIPLLRSVRNTTIACSRRDKLNEHTVRRP